MKIDLKNKVALVTGGSRGIGREIAISLSKAGATIALTYNINQILAEQVVNEIVASGGKAIAIKMKVEDRFNVKQSISKIIDYFGPISILVNNAAIAQEKPFDTIIDDDWDNMMAVNLRGPFICCQEVLSGMEKQRWGRIINISSIGGQWGGLNQVHYAAAKAGLINLTKSIAKIYSRYGVTSNAVSPGLVNTDMSQNELVTDAGKEKVINIPIGRIATAEEIANVVVFLASEEASYITGQTINVNGGMYFG